ncbi:MAG TPA: dolichyl-phosphate beta-glucosyltransferase [Thermoanaerobaculia bacterium]|nr:dolichyl-phosphate beta-glucosyltransferase [Thermoanaerobaculia bacterium]
MKLSVVIPAYNEGERLGPTLETVLAHLANRPGPAEVIVADDGSGDDTAAVAAAFAARGVRLVRLPENRGKGAALRAGVAASRGESVLLCDADLSTPIEEVERLEPLLATSEVVIGSRAVAASEILVHQPRFREWMGRGFNRLLQAVGLAGFRDTQCGFKLLAGDRARELFADLTIERFAFDVELLWLARSRGLRISEVGVRWAHSPASRVHPLRDSLNMLCDVLALRWRAWLAGRRQNRAGRGSPRGRAGRPDGPAA